MNPIKLYILIPILLILLSCNNQSAKTNKAELSDSIPEGAVPFEYEYKLKKAILIPGTLNDSVHLKYMLETGCQKMTFSDSLASDFETIEVENGFHKVQKTMKVRIGDGSVLTGTLLKHFILIKITVYSGFQEQREYSHGSFSIRKS